MRWPQQRRPSARGRRQAEAAGFAHLLQEAIALLTRAADRGAGHALFRSANSLPQRAGRRGRPHIVRSAGIWRDWNRLDGEESLESGDRRARGDLSPTTPPSAIRFHRRRAGQRIERRGRHRRRRGRPRFPPASSKVCAKCFIWLLARARAGTATPTSSKRSKSFSGSRTGS